MRPPSKRLTLDWGHRVSCYFIARIRVHDAPGYQRYLDGTDSLLRHWGATVLAVDESATVLEGSWPATRTVVIEFPDEASATGWFESPEYQSIALHRRAASDGDAVLVRGRESSV